GQCHGHRALVFGHAGAVMRGSHRSAGRGREFMAAPLVSVVVPVYNGAKYLRQALDSALGQTYPRLQLVIVDDGSTDSSAEIIASYGPRLCSIRQANAGVACARNAGIRAAAGDLIAFLDQDDWWLPEKVDRQVERF